MPDCNTGVSGNREKIAEDLLMNAPVALFVYKRLPHTRQTVESLLKNKLAASTDLIIFSDGPRSENDRAGVASVRDFIKSIQGFRKVTIHESPMNKGLAKSIIEGVTAVLAEHESVIVVEDDLEVSPGFLSFLNQNLDIYAADKKVMSISAYVYPVPDLPKPSFFIRGADCWGWAIWRDRWAMYEADGQKLLNQIRSQGLEREFDMGGGYPFTKMLEDQIAGRVNSWAIRFNATAFVNEMLTLYPSESLVRNIGLDGSGEHCDVDEYGADKVAAFVPVERVPVMHNVSAAELFRKFFISRRPRLINRIFKKIQSICFSKVANG